MSRSVRTEYRQSLFAVPDPRLRRALAVSGSLGLLVCCVVLLAPVRVTAPPRVDDVPERLAKLILERRVPPPPVLAPMAQVEVPAQVPEEVKPEPTPEPKADATPEPKTTADPNLSAPPRRPREDTKLPEDRGTAGRAQARAEVADALGTTTESVRSTLEGIQSDLAAISPGGSNVPERSGGRGRPGRGRSSGDVAGAVTARESVGDGSGGGTVVTGSLIHIESAGSGSGDLASTDLSSTAGSDPSGSYRSNASLLAVVRRYAAGIQFCYDNQLKREPQLEGKMVIVLTVLASGQVSEASIGEDSLGSPTLRECVLLQVREWKFPAIEEGVVTFRAPFVFTPPN